MSTSNKCPSIIKGTVHYKVSGRRKRIAEYECMSPFNLVGRRWMQCKRSPTAMMQPYCKGMHLIITVPIF